MKLIDDIKTMLWMMAVIPLVGIIALLGRHIIKEIEASLIPSFYDYVMKMSFGDGPYKPMQRWRAAVAINEFKKHNKVPEEFVFKI